jgi:hypothetical protein
MPFPLRKTSFLFAPDRISLARHHRSEGTVTNSLDLESLDSLDLLGRIGGDGLELGDGLLELIDNGLVLEDGSVMGEVDAVDALGLLEEGVGGSGVGDTLSEGGNGGQGLWRGEGSEGGKEGRIRGPEGGRGVMRGG